jgi:hypothetical protein
MPPTPTPLVPGEVFAGRFELREFLGRGGMGEVWSARDRVLDRIVALKVFTGSAAGGKAAARIRREVTVARDLAHPNLVRYYDIHEDGPRLGLSMEWVEGSTLQAALDRGGPLPEARVRPMLAALAEALEHLHARGIIHRDVKPSNIFLSGEGTVKLGDFGIVHLDEEAGLTRTGETPGTPTHMAPEQFLGRAPSPASDWYALGIVAYEMLSGAPPFTGTYGTVAAGHLERPAPALPAGTASSRLRRLAEGLLLKDPGRRWGARQVRACCAGGALPLLPRQRRSAWTAAAVLLLAAGLAAGRRMLHPPLTSVQVRPGSVAAFAGDRLAWEHPVEGLTDALLADTDGDGDREVAVGRWIEAGPGLKAVQVEVLERSGRPGPPLFLSRTLTNVFPAFHPRYETLLRDAGAGRMAIFIQHAQFYPFYGALWDGRAGGVVFNLAHSGRLYQAVPFHGGAAFEGINNRLLHQRVLLVTAPLGAAPASASVVDDVNLVTVKGLRAYHLLGDSETVRLEGPDWVRVRTGGGVLSVLENGDLEGMPGSAEKSLEFILEYRRVRDALLQGGGDEGRARLETLVPRAAAAGLAGYAALFTSLRAESLARRGDWRGASLAAEAGAARFPGFDQDLRIQAALCALRVGEAARAGDLLAGISSEYMVSRRDEVRTLVAWAAMAGSPGAGRAALAAVRPLLGSGPYWGPYMDLQAGWADLLEGRADRAADALRPALSLSGMEHHATGYFLSAAVSGTFDPGSFEAYLRLAGTRPEYLLWAGAAGAGNADKAGRHWALLEQDAFHSPDSMLMLALLLKVRDRYPALR